jgi:hypothetical protein
MCNVDTGKWFGDCLSCGDGFFRQFDAATCLDYCPTGSLKDLITKECSDPGFLPISEVVFNKLGVVYKGLPFGLYRLQPGYELGHHAPINTFDRGLFFDRNTGHVKISGIILNTNFSVHYWAYLFEFTGELLEVEAETPSTEDEEQTMTYSCGSSQDNTEEPEMGVSWNNGANNVSASGKLPLLQWVDLNLVAKYNDADSTMDI